LASTQNEAEGRKFLFDIPEFKKRILERVKGKAESKGTGGGKPSSRKGSEFASRRKATNG